MGKKPGGGGGGRTTIIDIMLLVFTTVQFGLGVCRLLSLSVVFRTDDSVHGCTADRPDTTVMADWA